MGLDRNAFVANYLEELEENLGAVDNGILALKKDPSNPDELTALLRALHTIKGSSRMLKFETVEKLAHGLENVFKGVREERYGISGDLIQLVFITTDAARRAAGGIRSGGSDSLDISGLMSAYEHAYAGEPYDPSSLRPEADSAAERQPDPAEHQASAVGDVLVKTAAVDGESQYDTIRINVTRIEKIIKLLNNLIIRQFQLRKENEVLQEFERSVKALGEFVPDNPNRAARFGAELETAAVCLKTLKKGFAEELPQIERSIFELQEEILSLRMLPLELILGNLGRMVEETSLIMKKEIRYTSSGTDLKLDKFILERLHDPVIHLVRNAVDHGIETPDEREAAGKNREGSLGISCSSEGGSIVISIKDDGRGFDYDRIRARAIEMNPLQKEDIAAMEAPELNAFLFMSGFSTKDEISELSGRGVGLDIVKFNIEKMKGKISVNSERGLGTEFRLSLPLSLATVNGFFITAGGEKFLIPASFVREIVIVPRRDELDLLNRKGYKLRNMIIPLYQLASVLDLKNAGNENREKSFVVVVENLGETVGIVVDSVIQYNSLIYKPLPRNLGSLKSVQGIVFDENYNIINILFIPDIVNRFKRIRGIDSHRRFSASVREYKKVLVVDDSFSTREIEKSILELEHYDVTTASDGIEGLEKAREQRFNLIVTDINMPRMDGLTFIENLRKDAKYAQVPVIVVSSDNDEERRKRFRAAGADRFIVKADFDRGNLVREVRELIG